MQSFFEWMISRPAEEKPWLILGKGPTFALRHEYDLRAYHLLSLNHVVRELPVEVAHIIDLDVVSDCGEALLHQAELVAMPWFPHKNHRPSSRSLEEWATRHPILAELEAQGRLAYYNLSSAPSAHPGSPIVQATYFSAEAAVNLLASAGVSKIRTLGVDGGNTYSDDFQDLNAQTLLKNGQKSFNLQFDGISKTINRNNLDFSPLELQSPAEIYIAATESEVIPSKVLEYSIRKHASISVKTHLIGIEAPPPPLPLEGENRPRTPFSFQRFLIPALANHTGRAIYLDSDMQVFRDIRELWGASMGEAALLAVREPDESARRPQFSVMLLDCARLNWDIKTIVAQLDAGQLTYGQLMYDMVIAEKIEPAIPPRWNSLESYVEDETALLHYTDMNSQPWVSTRNPLGYLWCQELIEAVDSGFISRSLLEEHITKGHIRPSLGYQLEHRIADPLLLRPSVVKALDRRFKAPFTQLARHDGTPWKHSALWLFALARAKYRQSFLHAAIRRFRLYLKQASST